MERYRGWTRVSCMGDDKGLFTNRWTCLGSKSLYQETCDGEMSHGQLPMDCRCILGLGKATRGHVLKIPSSVTSSKPSYAAFL